MKAKVISRLVDMTEIAVSGEDWELFAQDFLRELGFFIESQPDRGPDGGKDLLITENLVGALNRYKFRWLVSCKHFAHSDRAVGEPDEPNIQDRMTAFGADGFIGFYSTVPSSGLNNRLRGLKDKHAIRDYRFFDARLIENHLIRIGYSQILMRFFPASYKRIKPLHLIFSSYVPLPCDLCGRDLLTTVHEEKYDGLVGLVTRIEAEEEKDVICEIYFACKGTCDPTLERRYNELHKAVTKWEDLSDLVIPFTFLNWVISAMTELHDGRTVYLHSAHEKHKKLLAALSQRVFREMTEAERKRALSNHELLNHYSG